MLCVPYMHYVIIKTSVMKAIPAVIFIELVFCMDERKFMREGDSPMPSMQVKRDKRLRSSQECGLDVCI